MPTEQIDPQEAHRRMTEEDAVYLDVRTVEEFEAGHPAGSYNVPVLFNQNGQMVPNPNFLQEVEDLFASNQKLVVGCRTGGRSQQACNILEPQGYGDIANVQGSWAGTPAVQGWAALGLPSDTGAPEGRAYKGG